MSNIQWGEVHSILFVPSLTRRLVHIHEIRTDVFIVDLEDAIGIAQKEEAYKSLKNWLDNDFTLAKGKQIVLRINKGEIKKEAQLFGGYSEILGIAVPKVESAMDIIEVKEAFPDKDILALIETPSGMISLDSLAAMNEINALGFGGEDFCVAMGMKKKSDFLIPIKMQMLIRTKAFSKPLYDMVEAEYRDLELYRDCVAQAKEMGFSGKLAIHPKQVDIINEEFCDIDVENAKRIIAQYEKNDSGFAMIDGQIYEQVHIDALKKRIDNIKKRV